MEEAKRMNICNDCRLEIIRSGMKQSKRDKVCCNPLSIHGDNVKKKIREVNTTDLVEKAKNLNITIKIGQFICGKCRQRLLHSSKSTGAHEVVANT